MSLPRQIRTARLLLREPRPADAGPLFDGIYASAEVLLHLGLRPHGHSEQTRQHLSLALHRWLKQSGWLWVVALPSAQHPDGLAIGQVELTPMSHPGAQAHHLRLGYALGRPHWGQGWMREAVGAVLAAAWHLPAAWRVDALCDVDNHASSRLLTAVGMACEGRLARAVVHPNVAPQPRDAWLHACTRPLSDVAPTPG
ncbi:MAG: hypothetical protein RI907_2488 [Pseudomonadota bacterium]|jgi:RimJ/RimL family protein N-acetyltransferase